MAAATAFLSIHNNRSLASPSRKSDTEGCFGARSFPVLGMGGKRWLLPPHSKTLRESIPSDVSFRHRSRCDHLANFPDSGRLPFATAVPTSHYEPLLSPVILLLGAKAALNFDHRFQLKLLVAAQPLGYRDLILCRCCHLTSRQHHTASARLLHTVRPPPVANAPPLLI